MHFSGVGSMMQPHFRTGPIERPYAATPKEEALRELYFFDLLAAGIYIARRGMIAMSLPIGDAECDRLVAAVDEFCALRRPFMAADAARRAARVDRHDRGNAFSPSRRIAGYGTPSSPGRRLT